MPLDVDPDVEALRILRAGLTPALRAELAHLLNNALCPLVVDVADDDVPLREVRADVTRLLAVVREILR